MSEWMIYASETDPLPKITSASAVHQALRGLSSYLLPAIPDPASPGPGDKLSNIMK